MTGFGDARLQTDRLSIAVEVRTVNNKYLKIITKCPDAYASLESRMEKSVRQFIGRGSVTLSVRVSPVDGPSRYQLDHIVLSEYSRQITHLADETHLAPPPDLSSLLNLPGVVTELDTSVEDLEADWSHISGALNEALEKLSTFRAAEGQSMARELLNLSQTLSALVERTAERAPKVALDYRERLHERVGDLLNQIDVSVAPADLIREVGIFAERCDITEEVTRMRSHLEQMGSFLQAETSPGRKMDFLAQEMFREVNTIGSKANDIEIAHAVVDMKAAIEKMREILQNVE